MGNLSCKSNSIHFCSSFKENVQPLNNSHQIQQSGLANNPNHYIVNCSSQQRCQLSQLKENERKKTIWPLTQLTRQFLPDFPYNSSITKNSFNVLGEVGSGSFGTVYKVLELKTNNVYALKTLSKAQVIEENAIEQVRNEVHIQSICGHHTFIINSPYRWQSRSHLYIVTDFAEGGELFDLLKLYVILPITVIKLYIAEIALAIDFLHNAGIIHRDLKPENILLDSQGHIQLTDFGLAKWLPYGSKTGRVCGTFQYMAPEILNLEPYGHSVDWWSLGVVACLMLTAQYPKIESTSEKTSILVDLEEPSSIDLLHRLLDTDPRRRLHSVRTLKTISFYKGYNWHDVVERKVAPCTILRESVQINDT